MDIEKPKKSSDSESDEDNEKPLELEFVINIIDDKTLKPSEPLKTDLIVISTFGHPSAYITSKLPEKTTKIASYSATNRKAVPLFEVYLSGDKSTLFASFTETIPEVAYSPIAKLFFKQFSGKHVLLLDSIHNAKFNPHNVNSDEKFPQIRYLATSPLVHKKETDTKVKKLENGKTLSGVIADFFIHCELNKIPAEVYLVIFQEYQIIFDDIAGFEAIKHKHKNLDKVIKAGDVSAIIKAVNKKLFAKSLYL